MAQAIGGRDLGGARAIPDGHIGRGCAHKRQEREAA